jgi:Zn-dependent peptidase ImmA (M78 family)
MRNQININSEILPWAISRAGYELNKFPKVQQWIEGNKVPTLKQLEDFSKKVHLPFGYLFLPEPPMEKLPIPFFRSNGRQVEMVSINVYDTIIMLQQRQDWLKSYLEDNDFGPLPFVGKFRGSTDVKEIVADMRQTLGLREDWASQFKNWQDAQNHLVTKIEDQGIITVFNGVVGNSTSRNIPVEECRGFVLVDEIVPFMFINNADWKAAQTFTIGHELAHIWIGHSAGFDFRRLHPANNQLEKLCDQVAAEFLVPEQTFNEIWADTPSISHLARFFKVSEIVIARRALDTGKITKKMFIGFYNNYAGGEKIKKAKKPSGGNFYDTVKKRLSITFASHINNAVKSGSLLYRDAYKLTGLKSSTFNELFSKHI